MHLLKSDVWKHVDKYACINKYVYLHSAVRIGLEVVRQANIENSQQNVTNKARVQFIAVLHSSTCTMK